MYLIRNEKKSDFKLVEQLSLSLENRKNSDLSFIVHRSHIAKDYIKKLSFVADENGKISGAIICSQVSYKKDGQTIEGVCINALLSENFQEEQIIHQLMKCFIDEAKYEGYEFVIGKDENLTQFGFTKTENANALLKEYFVLNLKNKLDFSEAKVVLPNLLGNVSSEDLHLYKEHQEAKTLIDQSYEKQLKSTAKFSFGIMIVVAIIAVVLFILREKEVISKNLTTGLLSFAMAGCLISLGAINIRAKKTLSAVIGFVCAGMVIVLGIVMILQ